MNLGQATNETSLASPTWIPHSVFVLPSLFVKPWVRKLNISNFTLKIGLGFKCKVQKECETNAEMKSGRNEVERKGFRQRNRRTLRESVVIHLESAWALPCVLKPLLPGHRHSALDISYGGESLGMEGMGRDRISLKILKTVPENQRNKVNTSGEWRRGREMGRNWSCFTWIPSTPKAELWPCPLLQTTKGKYEAQRKEIKFLPWLTSRSALSAPWSLRLPLIMASTWGQNQNRWNYGPLRGHKAEPAHSQSLQWPPKWLNFADSVILVNVLETKRLERTLICQDHQGEGKGRSIFSSSIP